MDHSHEIWDKLPKEDKVKNIRQCVESGICHENLADQYRNRTYGVLKREVLFKVMQSNRVKEAKKAAKKKKLDDKKNVST